ncbi:hypothetical protein [Ectobacillus ponti]|uniref:Uncharacterized protein n=1 Tax=Ectobacillus ponti TaxID=2961894 RepID=A0AA41XA29_9BACI|nr:hypothetical protein [Ectobacillus ponti]MCP8969120.1 hypothetical protein [Ectobacillus ponti]
MEDGKLYTEGVRRLIDLGNKVSELYRELHEAKLHLQQSSRDSVKYDSFYLYELLVKQEGLKEAYEELLQQICINDCFDMKSWRTGRYSYDKQDVMHKVEEFNQRNGTNVYAEDVLKSLRFDYGMDIEMHRAERV